MKNKMIAVLAMLALAAPYTGMAADKNNFADIPDDWSREAIEYAIDNGILRGEGDHIYPQRMITRAEMAAVLVRALELSDKADLKSFSDVSSDDWYYEIMAAAVAAGIYVGDGDKLYPESNITREEAFTVIARAYKISCDCDLSVFTDLADVSEWAMDSTAALVGMGIVTGDGNMLRPSGYITRAETAQILYKIDKLSGIPQNKDGSMIYGTVDMSFADFFYGELNDIGSDDGKEPDLSPDENEILNEYRGDGYYDAVSSTASGAADFAANITAVDGSKDKTVIYGIKDVPVAVDAELYETSMQLIKEGISYDEGILEQIGDLKNITDNVPVIYKTLNSDGTYSKLYASPSEVKQDRIELDTSSAYGDYVFTLPDKNIPDADKSTLTSIILTTDSGKKYGLIPGRNISDDPYRFGISVGIKTTNQYGNGLNPRAFEDIEGEYITGIRYILNVKGAFKVYDITGFKPVFLKYKLKNKENITVSDISVTGDGTAIVSKRVPEDSSYKISAIRYHGEEVPYEVEGGNILLNVDSLKPGLYTAVFADDKYENIETSFVVESDLSGADVKLENGQLVFEDEEYNPVDYVSCIRTVTVNGKKYSADDVEIFDRDGAIIKDVSVDGKNIFETGQKYLIIVDAYGYNTFTFIYES